MKNLELENLLKKVLDKLGKKYEYIAHLGGGTYSNVYLLKHTLFDEHHALKILDYNFVAQKIQKSPEDDVVKKFNETCERFITEARMYKKLYHPNVVRIYDVDTVRDEEDELDIPFFIMDYIDGKMLSEIIEKEAPLELSRALSIMRDLLSALEAIHKGNIIHRDLKPSNIIIEKNSGKAVLIDLGIAKNVLLESRATSQGLIMGSPAYMAPEQFNEGALITPQTDFYSLGIVFYEMLTGEHPVQEKNFLHLFNSDTLNIKLNASAKNPLIPGKINTILTRLISGDPKNRYQTTQEFMEALASLDTPQKEINSSRYIIFGVLFLLALLTLFLFIDPLHLFSKKENNIQMQEKPIPPVTQVLPKEPSHEIKPVLAPPVETVDKKSEIEKGAEYIKWITQARKCLQLGDFTGANEALLKAVQIKNTPETVELSEMIISRRVDNELLNGTTEYNNLSNSDLTIQRYHEFKAKYPGSIHIEEYIKRIRFRDHALPPEKYWNSSLILNGKGFYEYPFNTGVGIRHVMVYIPGPKIWIDKYEVSNTQFRTFLKQEKTESPETVTQATEKDDEYPVVVTFEDADRYCKKLGFRLPSVEEWEYAAGGGRYIYPWGNERPGSSGKWQANFDTMQNGIERDGYKNTSPVNSFGEFASPFGVVGMAGNVWEWTYGYVLKGGGFLSEPDDLQIKKKHDGGPNDREGFRCVRDEKESQASK